MCFTSAEVKKVYFPSRLRTQQPQMLRGRLEAAVFFQISTFPISYRGRETRKKLTSELQFDIDTVLGYLEHRALIVFVQRYQTFAQ